MGLIPRADEPASRSRARSSWAALVAIPVFAAMYFGVNTTLPVPLWVIPLYVVASVVAFLAYWTDKRAAQAGNWRTPEATLHLIEVLGGWPGALIAQRVFRHKTRKTDFQLMFWAMVVLNFVAFVGVAYWVNRV